MLRQHVLALAAASAAAVVLATTTLTPAIAAPAIATPALTAAGAPADFNGDGYPDLATSAHSATVGGLPRAGMLSVQYGSRTGLQTTAALISRATPGVPGEPTENGGFGSISGQGDVNHDGYTDLIVRDGHGVLILRGGKDGLTGRGPGRITYGSRLPDGSYLSPNTAVAVGDVTGDGVPDILTVADEKEAPAGKLVVFQGPFDFATGKPAAVQVRHTTKLDGLRIIGLYIADMTGDGIADVVATGWNNGVVYAGGPAGPTPVGIVRGPTDGAFGDIDKDGYQDFVGGEAGQFDKDGSRIHVSYGGPKMPRTLSEVLTYTQDSPGVPGVAEADDRWGSAVAVGDTDGDGYADIVVGAPWETGTDLTATHQSGSVTVLRGSASGITGTGSKVFTQNSAGIPSTSERFDHFGARTTLLDSDKDGRPELYVSGYGEDNFTGRVWKLKTDPTGVTGTGATSHNLAGLGGPSGRAHFGYAFGAGKLPLP
ncbi:FG-GAP and VCBS repeat-containing protein [Streptomyces sp. NPDC006487]|uniref:FG-GAP and VCBS repeat-containing protein n=1 Tax=Streptomyces sp. NPDC006487 TaxID=3364748 RepID=UPI0036765B80